MRVVVRYRLPEADAWGRHLSDALGELLEVNRDDVLIATRRGRVRVPRRAVVLAKEVPPPRRRQV